MKIYKGKTKEVDATDYIKYLHKIINQLYKINFIYKQSFPTNFLNVISKFNKN